MAYHQPTGIYPGRKKVCHAAGDAAEAATYRELAVPTRQDCAFVGPAFCIPALLNLGPETLNIASREFGDWFKLYSSHAVSLIDLIGQGRSDAEHIASACFIIPQSNRGGVDLIC